MKNSLKQMIRTPVRTTFFLILLVFASLLMTLGSGIWTKGKQTMEQYEDRFITIGTVRQIPDSFEQTLQWNAETRDYDVIKKAQYTSFHSPEDMLFPEAEYIAEPEQRAFYISYVPDYLMLSKSLNPNMLIMSSLIAEFSPMENCIPNESVKIQITKVIGGDKRMEGVVDYFCDHRNPNPKMLYKNKTYVAVLRHGGVYIHGKAYDELMSSKNEVHIGLEYMPDSLESGLMQADGNRLEKSFQGGQQIFEVTDGFYETDAGRRLLNLGKLETIWQYCQPVTGTNKTCLLMPFYNRQAYICEGRDISEEEYAAGSKVCLASETFMKNNGLSLGDQVKVNLIYTDRKINAGRKFFLDGSLKFYSGMIDTSGKPLEIFEISEYTVVGIYDTNVGSTDSIFNMGADELIVPMESIEMRNGKNLMDCGAMTDTTSSFQIPNGSIDRFLKDWTEHGTENLEISFYDGGYSKLKAGIDNMRNLSLFLFLSGLILTGLLLFFFSHLFITQQAKRTAVERALGMKKIQCGWSVLSGFILLLLLGSIIGSLAGVNISEKISLRDTAESYYDNTFTVGTIIDENQIEVEESENKNDSAVFCTFLIIVSGMGISFVKMDISLKKEPMELLSVKQD